MLDFIPNHIYTEGSKLNYTENKLYRAAQLRVFYQTTLHDSM